MAKNKKRKQPKKNPVPIGIEYVYDDGLFKLYKVWSKKNMSTTPFYITDDINEMVDEIAEKKEIWRVTIDFPKLLKFTEHYK